MPTYGMFVNTKEPQFDSEVSYEENEIPIIRTANNDYCLLSAFRNQVGTVCYCESVVLDIIVRCCEPWY